MKIVAKTAAQCLGLTLTEARQLLHSVYPDEWDVIELCCDGDPYAHCPRGLVAALAEMGGEQVCAVSARLSRARARLLTWIGDPAQALRPVHASAAASPNGMWA